MTSTMTLSPLPTDKTKRQWWSYKHFLDHEAIRIATLAQKGIVLTQYNIDPILDSQLDDFYQNHQQLHDDFNAALGLQSTQLQDIDLSTDHGRWQWASLHHREHVNAGQVLGI